MFFRQPSYRNYSPNNYYEPYQHSYQRPSPFESIPARDRRFLADEGTMQEYARTLAERRARRAQYLPDEDVNSEDEWEYNQLGPREQVYLEAKRRQAIVEQRQREEELERQRVFEEQKWQEDLERKQREDDEHRRTLLDERKRELRLKREEDARQEERERESSASQTTARTGPSAAPHEDKSVPICIPVQLQQETPPPSPPQSSVAIEPEVGAHTLEEMNDAASRIQREYRVHRATLALDDIMSQFRKLQEGFAYPRIIDFKKPGGERGHITVPANRPPSDFSDEEALKEVECDGKLDYTSTNYPLHAYSEALDKLLMKLDEVESRGEERIREKRRGIVKDIEKEESRLDWYWKQAWADYNKAQEVAMDIQEDHHQL